MFKVEVKDLGTEKKELCETFKNLDYKGLVNLVSPYVKEPHLAFSIPNDSLDGTSWGYIYAGEKHIGEIKITQYNGV